MCLKFNLGEIYMTLTKEDVYEFLVKHGSTESNFL